MAKGERPVAMKKEAVARLILDKVDFKLTLIKRDKEGHSILIKGEIHQKEITNINQYAPNVSAPNFIKHTLKELKADIKEEITTNTKKIQAIITDYFENLHSNELENLEEMDKFLDTYDHPKVSQEDINHLNRCVICNEIEAAIESPKKKHLGPDGFCAEFYQTFKEN
jgi:uncharacterized membrane protein YheB (UPF0754 family)